MGNLLSYQNLYGLEAPEAYESYRSMAESLKNLTTYSVAVIYHIVEWDLRCKISADSLKNKLKSRDGSSVFGNNVYQNTRD